MVSGDKVNLLWLLGPVSQVSKSTKAKILSFMSAGDTHNKLKPFLRNSVREPFKNVLAEFVR